MGRRVHDMWPIATDDPMHLGVCQSKGLPCANPAERIEVLLWVETLRDPRNIVLDGNPNFPHRFDAALLWPVVLTTIRHRTLSAVKSLPYSVLNKTVKLLPKLNLFFCTCTICERTVSCVN